MAATDGRSPGVAVSSMTWRFPRGASNYEEVRALAKRRLPKALFEFVDRGCEREIAIRRNTAAFDDIVLLPRILVDVADRTTRTEMLGRSHGMPVAVAPTGAAGLYCYEGEVELAKAAAAHDIPFTLATQSLSSIETIAERAGGTLWFQLYPSADESVSISMLDRAKSCGYDAVLITADTQTVPLRNYNERNGFVVPFRVSPRLMLDGMLHPHWLFGVAARYVRARHMPAFENMPGRPSILKSDNSAGMLNPRLDWAAITRFRDRWPRKLMVKGLLSQADADEACRRGIDVIVVSNHGGRNLDASPAPIDVLRSILETVAGRASVLVDGGVRSGGDVAKAVALGAAGVLVGRATLYGLAVGGGDGAMAVLSMLQRELHTVLALLGRNSPADLGPDVLVTPGLPKIAGATA